MPSGRLRGVALETQPGEQAHPPTRPLAFRQIAVAEVADPGVGEARGEHAVAADVIGPHPSFQLDVLLLVVDLQHLLPGDPQLAVGRDLLHRHRDLREKLAGALRRTLVVEVVVRLDLGRSAGGTRCEVQVETERLVAGGRSIRARLRARVLDDKHGQGVPGTVGLDVRDHRAKAVLAIEALSRCEMREEQEQPGAEHFRKQMCCHRCLEENLTTPGETTSAGITASLAPGLIFTICPTAPVESASAWVSICRAPWCSCSVTTSPVLTASGCSREVCNSASPAANGRLRRRPKAVWGAAASEPRAARSSCLHSKSSGAATCPGSRLLRATMTGEGISRRRGTITDR